MKKKEGVSGSKHPTLGYNNSQLICKHSSSKEIEVDEKKYCSSGDWKNIEIHKGRYEIINQNEEVSVKYLGTNTVIQKKYLFEQVTTSVFSKRLGKTCFVKVCCVSVVTAVFSFCIV